MVDASMPGGGVETSICPWCSAAYTGDPETCPSCGAALTTDPATDPSLPGLTAIDTAAIVRAKSPAARPRSRLLSWISGEYPEAEGAPGDAAALAPPDVEVRREMLRLELEAEVANLHAEAEALRAEAVVESREEGVAPEDAAAAADAAAELEHVAAELERVDAALDTDPLLVVDDVPAAGLHADGAIVAEGSATDVTVEEQSRPA
jgi:hypothetical protein